MSASTPRYGFVYPSPTDPTAVPANMQTFLDEIDAIITCTFEGLQSALPAAGIFGRRYFATDTQQIFFDTGSVWLSEGHLNLSTGNITTSTPGDVVSAGSSGLAADAAHRHGREAWGQISDFQPAGTAAAGASSRVADAAHVHPHQAWGLTADYQPPGTAGPGSTNRVADAGHIHPAQSLSMGPTGATGATGATGPGLTGPTGSSSSANVPFGLVPFAMTGSSWAGSTPGDITQINVLTQFIPATNAITDVNGDINVNWPRAFPHGVFWIGFSYPQGAQGIYGGTAISVTITGCTFRTFINNNLAVSTGVNFALVAFGY